MDNTQKELKEARRLAKILSGHLQGDVGYLVESAKDFLEKYPDPKPNPEKEMKEAFIKYWDYETYTCDQGHDKEFEILKKHLSPFLITDEKRAEIKAQGALEVLQAIDEHFNSDRKSVVSLGIRLSSLKEIYQSQLPKGE